MDEKIVEAFQFGVLQECKNLILKLDEHKVPWGEFLLWLEDKKMFKRLGNNPMIRPCPDCEKPLRLSPVNTEPWNMVGEGLKSQWFCVCGYSKYSDQTVMEEVTLAREEKERELTKVEGL